MATEPMVEYRKPLAMFTEAQIESIAKLFGDTTCGLTGSEIGHLLLSIRVADSSPAMTKWKRLYNALVEHQNKHQVGNHIVQLITRAMAPAKFTTDPHRFDEWLSTLNPILAFSGMELGRDGKVRPVRAAKNIDDAVARANRMKDQLERRGVHSEIFRFCTAEIVAQNYFHTVFEAMKSVTSRIRAASDLSGDGSDLVDAAFGSGAGSAPVLTISDLSTETLRGEQRGFVNLVKGLYGVMRNPLSHEPKIEWPMSEQDALDILTTISLVHRKLDVARRLP